jgi:membrane-associated phospholipid phosphatase
MKRFALVAFLIFTSTNFVRSQNADIHWLRCINEPVNVPLDNAMKFTSNTVTPLMIGIPVGLFTYDLITHQDQLTRNKTIVIAAALGTNAVITFGLKYAVNRPRPFVTYPDIIKKGSAGSKSFPSGHTSTAFALATALSLEYPKWYIIAPSYMWACTVGYSRMRLGVHYPSDVACGAIIGSGCAFLSWWINEKLVEKENRHHFTMPE